MIIKLLQRCPTDVNEVVIVRDPEQALAAMDALEAYPGPKVFGWDSEHWNRRKGAPTAKDRKFLRAVRTSSPAMFEERAGPFLALIQVATLHGVVFIFDIVSLQSVPERLQLFFRNPEFWKIVQDSGP